MAAAGPGSAYEVSQDERTMSVLAHVLQVVCAWIAPLIIFVLKRDSLFVKFHALQALILQICLGAFWIIGGAVFMVTLFASMATSTHNAPPASVFYLFPIFWLVGMSVWVVVLVIAILYAIKAGRGEWADYPVIGRLVRHVLKIELRHPGC